ncbi:MAG: RDD family protein [Gammaproteobacteria bacterium]|nr:RDD family protein [Gammaproteobacteria bacterium]
MSTGTQPSRSSGVPTFAGFWVRACARLVDWVLLIAALALFPFAWRAIQAAPPPPLTTVGFAFGLHALYFILTTASPLGGTPGKRLLGLGVYGPDGARPTVLRASVRYLGYLPCWLSLGAGFVLAGVTREKRGLHDLLADTVVVVLDTLETDGDHPTVLHGEREVRETITAGLMFAAAIAVGVGISSAFTAPSFGRFGDWLRAVWIVGTRAGHHPGAVALRTIGCDAQVLTVGQAFALVEPFLARRVHDVRAADVPYVTCTPQTPTPPDCATVATTFAQVFALPPPQLVVVVRGDSVSRNLCQGYYTPAGKRLGGVGPGGELLVERR